MKRLRPHRLPRPPTARRGIEALEGRRMLDAVWFDGGGGDGQWNNPANWYGHAVPTAQDDVSIAYSFNVTLAGAPAAVRTLSMGESATLNVQTSLAIGMSSYAQPGTTLHLQPGGTLDGAGDLYLLGELRWTGGTMQGSGSTIVAFGGSARVTGPDVKDLRRAMRVEDYTEVNDTTVRFRGGTLDVDPRAWIGLINAQFLDDGGVNNRFDNAGMLNASGFNSTVAVPIYHSGTAEIYGSLYLAGGGSASGPFELFPTDSRLRVGGPGYTFAVGAKVFGEGAAVAFVGGTSTVAEPLDVSSLYLSGAAVTLDQNVSVSGDTHVEGASVLNLAGAVSTLKTIGVETASRIKLIGNGSNVLRTTHPGIHETARLDIGREAVIFDYAPGYSALYDVRAMISSGYADGAWTGSGICSQVAGTSQRAIGYGEASSLFSTFPATFMGQTIDDTAVLVRYTRYGDANLDGTVDLADFNRLAGGFGATDAYWTQGEFNYDQSVNLADFNLLAVNFGKSVSGGADAFDEFDDLST